MSDASLLEVSDRAARSATRHAPAAATADRALGVLRHRDEPVRWHGRDETTREYVHPGRTVIEVPNRPWPIERPEDCDEMSRPPPGSGSTPPAHRSPTWPAAARSTASHCCAADAAWTAPETREKTRSRPLETQAGEPMPHNSQPHDLPADVLRVDEGLVCGDDQPYFPAQLSVPQVAATDETGRRFYAVTPRFRRLVTEWVAITVEATSDHLRFRWDGDDLIVIDEDARDDDSDPTSGPAVERIRPDADGRYTFATWVWHVHDPATEHLDDTTHAALTLLATDDPQPADLLIRYVAGNTYPATDPQTLRTICHRHRTSANPPEAPAQDTDVKEAHDE
ncbi:hypothetical protein [Amycolatopsis nalaikhensis]|uniref:Uncharacterized protein n=1 Tax=Amycolatopsis nalaikhensis TaxID=715472 RepID=A0ABY8X8Z8_9PSEU|nr:hypothetical protein [Amycolatopsis sp. 2-2]WIV52869.1 hypothetical protein QP939_28410 [Amycolatopsis sp. 2-2]